MPPQSAQAPRRILVIKLGHIGDVLVTTPVIAALKQAYPQAGITALVKRGTQDMLLHNPRLEKVLVLEKGSGLSGLAGQLGLIAALRRGRFDLCLELSGGDRGAFLSFASGARFRVGFEPKEPHFRARAFHLLVDSRGTQNHVVETFLRQVRALGLEPEENGLEFQPGPQAEAWAKGLLAKHKLEPGSYALVHPTSRWMFKSWTPQGNAQVIKHLTQKGVPVILTCAPAKAETNLVQEILALLGPDHEVLDLSGQLDLLKLGALIKQARLFFGVDSAPMHMAAAQQVPIAVLFGPSGEQMWGPYRAPGRVISFDWDCRPCGRDGCDGSKVSRCLVEMPPERAIAAVDELLEQG